MTDPLGLIGNLNPPPGFGAGRITPLPGLGGGARRGDAAETGPGFKEMLQQQIDQVNRLQNDASMAMEDLAAGRRDDVESVIIATQKADVAFKMLLQVRNKVMDAYEEVKQLRI